MQHTSTHNLQPLDHRFCDVDWYPTNSNYHTPYSLVLKVPDPLPHRGWANAIGDFRNEVSDFVRASCTDTVYIKTHPQNELACRLGTDTIVVRAQTLDDLYAVYVRFYPQAQNVSGPFNLDHCRYLQQSHYSLQHKEKLYYGCYNCRVALSVGYSVSSAVGAKTMLKEAAEIVAHNVQKFRRQRARGYYAREHLFYMDIEDAESLLPMLILGTGSSVNYYITLCVPKMPAQLPTQTLLFPDK